MKSVDLMSLWTFVCSVHLCYSVRKRTIAKLAGEVFLSQRRHIVTAKLGDEFWER